MFNYGEWNCLCKILDEKNIHSVPAKSIKSGENIFILKHDVETSIKKAYKMAVIEYFYNHKGSYYLQASILKNKKNIKYVNNIIKLGHEVSYHHDVMDAANGDIIKAEKIFEKNINKFKNIGIEIKTVCQHGNPVKERKNYYSNRDFFRNKIIQKKYNDILDIMVNYKQQKRCNYTYISDAGYNWKIIVNPEFADIPEYNSVTKDIKINIVKFVESICNKKYSVIISTHPHRWYKNNFISKLNIFKFKILKLIATKIMNIKPIKKILKKYYTVSRFI